MAERAVAEGITPLELILRLMRQYDAEGKLSLALDAAVKAAPYVHPRLQTTQLTGAEGGPLVVELIEEVIRTAGPEVNGDHGRR